MASKRRKKEGASASKDSFSFIDQKITRRQFLTKAAIGVVGLGALAYGLDKGLLRNLAGLPASVSTTFKNSAPETLWKWAREASFWERAGDLVRCELCPHRCLLEEDDRGVCRTRVNKDGKLYTLSYGNPCAVHTDPIEKKPVYHFLPGTKAFSIATAGCNLRCKFCQNWDISQTTPESLRNYDMMPDDTVQKTLDARSSDPMVRSIAYTYSEPAAFYDYMLDTSKLARDNGIKNVVITAGYISKKPLEELSKHVDVIKIDLKGFNERFYRDVCSAELEGVLESIKTVRRQKGVWMELVNLVVPTLNDDLGEIREMCAWVVENVGSDVPLHFSRFQPQYKLLNLPPTPVATLVEAREIALDAGIHYVYVGNADTPEGNNTYCPKDKTLCIRRNGFVVEENRLAGGRCPTCGTEVAGVWS